MAYQWIHQLELVSTHYDTLITPINLSNHRPKGRPENESGSPFKEGVEE